MVGRVRQRQSNHAAHFLDDVVNCQRERAELADIKRRDVSIRFFIRQAHQVRVARQCADNAGFSQCSLNNGATWRKLTVTPRSGSMRMIMQRSVRSG